MLVGVGRINAWRALILGIMSVRKNRFGIYWAISFECMRVACVRLSDKCQFYWLNESRSRTKPLTHIYTDLSAGWATMKENRRMATEETIATLDFFNFFFLHLSACGNFFGWPSSLIPASCARSHYGDVIVISFCRQLINNFGWAYEIGVGVDIVRA